jgi:hypothetical protein
MVLTFENNLNINTNIKGNLNINSNINVKKNISLEGNLLLFGDMCVDEYINFGKILTTNSGYGIRDNSGNIQVKSDGGSWNNISTTLWNQNGNELYYDVDNVGIGTNNPNYTLEVYGNLSVSTNSNVSGNMNITSNLNVSNYSNFAGNISIATIGSLKDQSLTINHPTGSRNNKSFLDFQYNGVQIGSVEQATTSSVIYNTTSDYRLKENITKIDKPLERLMKLKPYNYNYKTDPDKLQEGLIAHEVMEIVPFAVSGKKDEMEYKCTNCNKNDCECYWYEEGKMELKPKYQKIAYSNLIPLLIGSIQELKKQLNNISNK